MTRDTTPGEKSINTRRSHQYDLRRKSSSASVVASTSSGSTNDLLAVCDIPSKKSRKSTHLSCGKGVIINITVLVFSV